MAETATPSCVASSLLEELARRSACCHLLDYSPLLLFPTCSSRFSTPQPWFDPKEARARAKQTWRKEVARIAKV